MVTPPTSGSSARTTSSGLGVVVYAPRGPLVDPKRNDVWDAAAALADVARERTRAFMVRASPAVLLDDAGSWTPLEAHGFRRLPDLWSLWNTPRNVMRLDLEGDERDILARMAKKRRQHISTASKKAVSADVVRGLSAMHVLRALMLERGAHEPVIVPSPEYLEGLHALFDADGGVATVLGSVNGELAGASGGRCATVGAAPRPCRLRGAPCPGGPRARRRSPVWVSRDGIALSALRTSDGGRDRGQRRGAPRALRRVHTGLFGSAAADGHHPRRVRASLRPRPGCRARRRTPAGGLLGFLRARAAERRGAAARRRLRHRRLPAARARARLATDGHRCRRARRSPGARARPRRAHGLEWPAVRNLCGRDAVERRGVRAAAARDARRRQARARPGRPRLRADAERALPARGLPPAPAHRLVHPARAAAR